MITRRNMLAASFFAGLCLPTVSRGQPKSSESGNMKFKITFNGMSLTGTLEDKPAATDLLAMLPLDLKIEDHSTNEKIAYLPRKLKRIKDDPFNDARPGDIGYYAPWGNLVFYYDSYRYSPGLIRLGRFEGGFDPLLTRGEFPLRIEAV
ncbi:MFS transporter [Rhizobium sp. Root1203]|uniref:cyclophilin-like fold protein n=1 Tax=Rhizobium sp. Root1203 TaxID=1736427 RepID=UPI00070A6BAC|nr:cyclophilin-like fold protein [Rhizobium sp. Root1203]KQV15008.1 MFS transporter [Rhizobium sp. Root1203]